MKLVLVACALVAFALADDGVSIIMMCLFLVYQRIVF